MKHEFIEFLNALMEACPELVEEKMTDEIQAYIQALSEEIVIKKPITDNGRLIINFMRQNENVITWKSRDLACSLGISSRSVSGSMRKLVSDNFVEKIGSNPFSYALTEKGKTYNIENIEE